MDERSAYSGWPFNSTPVKLRGAYFAMQTSGGLQDGSDPPPSARTGVTPNPIKRAKASNMRTVVFFTSLILLPEDVHFSAQSRLDF
jgi:hypothetical protein